VKPRILVVIKGLGIGGAERLISAGSEFWSTNAFDYKVAYLLPHKDALVPDLKRRGIPVTCFGDTRGVSIRALGRLAKLCREASLVHAHLPATGILARLVAGRTPVIYTEHNLPTSYRPITRAANRATYWRNSVSVAVSDAVERAVDRYPGRKALIANGVGPVSEARSSEDVRRHLDIPPAGKLVVHVGNIRPGKGHDALVDVATRVAMDRPDVSFVSIGSEKIPGDLTRLRARVADAGLNGQLRFLGPRPDAIDFISAADVFVNPSEVEGLPVAILEAMALGRPVVATDVGGVSSVVRHGDTGYLVPALDTQALADRVVALIDDPLTRATMGERGKRLVEESFSLREMVSNYENLYLEVLNR